MHTRQIRNITFKRNYENSYILKDIRYLIIYCKTIFASICYGKETRRREEVISLVSIYSSYLCVIPNAMLKGGLLMVEKHSFCNSSFRRCNIDTEPIPKPQPLIIPNLYNIHCFINIHSYSYTI